MEKLIDAELERIRTEMEKALKEAQELCEHMSKFLGQSENEVKTFLENQKFQVEVLSLPTALQENPKFDKEVFDD